MESVDKLIKHSNKHQLHFQLSTTYLFGVYSHRITWEWIKNQLYIMTLSKRIGPGLKNVRRFWIMNKFFEAKINIFGPKANPINFFIPWDKFSNSS